MANELSLLEQRYSSLSQEKKAEYARSISILTTLRKRKNTIKASSQELAASLKKNNHTYKFNRKVDDVIMNRPYTI
jgi:hypothetical protein